MEKSKKLRAALKSGEVLRVVGAHNGLTAKLVEMNGFDGIWASGLEISTSYAVPDASILTMTEFLNAAQIMNSASSLPIIADCDCGFGNALNVINMVNKYEQAGIAAVCIEDKIHPKMNSFVDGRQELIPIAEFAKKIEAAKENQTSKDFLVFARVEALVAGKSLEEALLRANAYAEAGADGIFIHSKSEDTNEIEKFVERWDVDLPLLICPTTYSSITYDKIKQLKKINVVIYANYGIRAQIRAVNQALSELKEAGTAKAIEKGIASMEEVFDIQGMPKHRELEKRYLIPSKRD